MTPPTNDADGDAIRRAEEFVAANKERQRADAETLRPNQCPGCGAYRLDGEPPCIHQQDCPWGKSA